MTRIRRFYGDQLLHLMAMVVSFAVVAAGVAGWFQAGSDPRGIILWLLASAIAFEGILLPIAWAFDRVAFGGARSKPLTAGAQPTRRVVAFVRIPAMLSALLGLVSLPLILRLDTSAFIDITGSAPPDYLVRWLLASAAMFAISTVWYAVTLRRGRG
jgi:hypothetical protein